MEYKTIDVDLQQLLLDPNNYRFFDMEKYREAAQDRFHEPNVQNRANELVHLDGKDELRTLKESIEANGYVPVEVLVVKPYKYKDSMFVIVEGNRRVAAMRWLKEDQAGGSQIKPELIESFKKLPAIVLESNEKDLVNLQHVLMGLRHVSGIKQWGGYQRAKLVAELVDDLGLLIATAAKQISMTPHEAIRRYRALKALEQMQNDDEFGSYCDPKMYRLFHEAVSVVKLKNG